MNGKRVESRSPIPVVSEVSISVSIAVIVSLVVAIILIVAVVSVVAVVSRRISSCFASWVISRTIIVPLPWSRLSFFSLPVNLLGPRMPLFHCIFGCSEAFFFFDPHGFFRWFFRLFQDRVESMNHHFLSTCDHELRVGSILDVSCYMTAH